MQVVPRALTSFPMSAGHALKMGGGSPEVCSGCRSFHVQARLPDGCPSLIVDPGSVGNLCGDAWAKGVAAAARQHGHKPSYAKRGRPLRVQSCNYDCTLPIALKQKDKSVALGQVVTPTVSGSDLPGVLGLQH